jgi:hypothetical protein
MPYQLTEVTMPPTDQNRGVREMLVRYPDGHVIRISQDTGEPEL